MSDDALPPVSTAPRGPRSAGLAVVLPPSQAAAVVDLTARRTRAAVDVDLTAADRATPAPPVDESQLSIQDRVRLRALESDQRSDPRIEQRTEQWVEPVRQLAQVAPWPGRTPSTR